MGGGFPLNIFEVIVKVFNSVNKSYTCRTIERLGITNANAVRVVIYLCLFKNEYSRLFQSKNRRLQEVGIH